LKDFIYKKFQKRLYDSMVKKIRTVTLSGRGGRIRGKRQQGTFGVKEISLYLNSSAYHICIYSPVLLKP
jgi:hypothetical protein